LPESTSRAESAPPFPLPRQLNPAISPNVEQAILRALDTNREKRFQTIQEMRQALVKPAPIPDQEQSLSATLIVQPPTGLSQYPAQPSPGQQFPTAGTMAIPQTGAPPSPARTLPGWLWAGAGLAGLVFICLAGVILMRMFSASGAKPAAGLPSPTSLALSATLSPTPIAASPVSPTPGQPAPTQPSITQALPPTQPLPPAAQPPQLPAAAATLQLEQAFNCRGGPNVQYDLIWTFSAGTVLQIIGKSENNWWLVRINDPRTRRQQCWIGGGVPQGDLSQVPISEWTGTAETAKTPWP
jgi:serine/threonine protein kinase